MAVDREGFVVKKVKFTKESWDYYMKYRRDFHLDSYETCSPDVNRALYEFVDRMYGNCLSNYCPMKQRVERKRELLNALLRDHPEVKTTIEKLLPNYSSSR